MRGLLFEKYGGMNFAEEPFYRSPRNAAHVNHIIWFLFATFM